MTASRKVAIEPSVLQAFTDAVKKAGGEVARLDHSVEALVWTDYHQPELLRKTLDENPQLKWVQLPFAGVDAFADILKRPITFTSAKGAYREPVAEHALALTLALCRAIPMRIRSKSWGEKFAVSLYESRVLVLGAGGITDELLRLLKPFGCEVAVVRNQPQNVAGATSTHGFAELDDQLAQADVVILALALTDTTRGLFDLARFKKMKPTAYLVNIARGGHVVTEDLIAALEQGLIAGAGVDVTDPEPLPDGHPLWHAPNIIITPHTADTPAQVTRMFAARIGENVAAYLAGEPFVGEVDPILGY